MIELPSQALLFEPIYFSTASSLSGIPDFAPTSYHLLIDFYNGKIVGIVRLDILFNFFHQFLV